MNTLKLPTVGRCTARQSTKLSEAISAAPHFAEAHAALGYALFYGELDIMAADEPYERARQFGSGSPDVLGLYAIYRARRRQFDRARPAIARAVELDPINPSVFKNVGKSALRLVIMREQLQVPGARSISIRKSAQLTETLAMLSSCKVELTKLPLNSGGRGCTIAGYPGPSLRGPSQREHCGCTARL